MSKSLSKLLPFFLLIVILFPLVIQAKTVILDPPTKHENFQQLIDSIINIIFTLALAIAPIMILVAAFYFITAAGDPAKIEIAKKIILWTLIGLLIVFSAKGIIKFFKDVVGLREP